MKLLISQSAVVPVPACCAPDTAEHNNGQFFSAGGSFRAALTVLPSYSSLVCNPAFSSLVLSGATLYCFRGEDVIRPLILKEFNE
jgi:hypothetical protein